ncbi:hypothetical protein JCM17823_05180 [Halorubrum gandharaense]
MTTDSDDGVRVWLVERTYSDDEQNLIILTYTTTDGERYFRKERALTSFTDVRDTTAAVTADPDNLGTVDGQDLREQYAAEAQRMSEVHDPDDINALLRYLETHGEVNDDQLPEWDEFQEIAADYEVPLPQ